VGQKLKKNAHFIFYLHIFISWKKNRYARLSECEIDKMLSDKDAVATKKVTKVAIRNLQEYILENK
jgi:hypothetical protein